MIRRMELRPATTADTPDVLDIDGTVESHDYLHVDVTGEELSVGFKIEPRPLRDRLIAPLPMDDEQQFAFRQVAAGHDDGTATVAVHDGRAVGLILAQAVAALDVIRLLDLRVDFDHRREGLASALLYGLIGTARDSERRAITAETTASNGPANALLAKTGFQITGLDTHRRSNHDLVKEAVTVFWYLTLG